MWLQYLQTAECRLASGVTLSSLSMLSMWLQAQRAAEDVGKNLPSGGDATSALKNNVPALPKVGPPHAFPEADVSSRAWLRGQAAYTLSSKPCLL